ncbi:hypothetical protein LINPERPRIM_LOCUS4290, partial [Linum perenne]
VVQPTRPENQPKTIHRRGRGEVVGCSPYPRKQVGIHLPPLPWSNRQRSQEPLARHHGSKAKGTFQALCQGRHY